MSPNIYIYMKNSYKEALIKLVTELYTANPNVIGFHGKLAFQSKANCSYCFWLANFVTHFICFVYKVRTLNCHFFP